MAQLVSPESDRRSRERRRNQVLAELTLPELRRVVITSALFLLVLGLFLWMVRTVLIGAILAVILAFYLRPLYRRILRLVGSPTWASILTICVIILPLLGTIAYSYAELQDAAEYLAHHETEITARIDQAVHRIPFFEGKSFTDQIRNGVLVASNFGARVIGGLKSAATNLGIAAAVFLFTMFYVFTQASEIVAYLRSKVPPRYNELMAALQQNVRGVLYGAIYATLLTQSIKSLIILGMNLAFHVPLAVVLAILSFVIGFFPIVGSWSIYLPVAVWLMIFREAYVSALLMLVIGFFGNTLFISMYLRPKIAAEKSQVLNFYWMFIGLVTGVYTFGLVGVLLGPLIIGLLKATLDTVTSSASWRLLDADADAPAAGPIVVASDAGPGS